MKNAAKRVFSTIYLQKLVAIQPKTSEILQKICQNFAKHLQLPYGSTTLRRGALRGAQGGQAPLSGSRPACAADLTLNCIEIRYENTFLARRCMSAPRSFGSSEFSGTGQRGPRTGLPVGAEALAPVPGRRRPARCLEHPAEAAAQAFGHRVHLCWQ